MTEGIEFELMNATQSRLLLVAEMRLVADHRLVQATCFCTLRLPA